MQHDGCHSSGFVLRIDRSSFDLYDTTQKKKFVTFCLWVGFGFSLNGDRQDIIKFVSRLSTWFGVWNFRMGCMTLAHPQTNHHDSQFVHCNQAQADM